MGRLRAFIFILWSLSLGSSLHGADVTPFGLQPAAPTTQWQSGDARAQQIQALFSPYYNGGQFNTTHLNWSGEGGFRNQVNEITPSNPTTNPYRLAIPNDGARLRVYFLDETAGYQNTLGIVNSTPSGGPNPLEVAPDPNTLIFPSASFTTSSSSRTENNPVKPMDYVDLGWVNEGSLFEFFVIAEGGDLTDGEGTYNDDTINFEDPEDVPAEGIFFTDPNHNLPSDDLTMHFRIYEIPGYNNLYLFRVEDLLYGGDNNFNDLYFLVELAVPEPRTYVMLGSFLALCAIMGTWAKRRQLQIRY